MTRAVRTRSPYRRETPAVPSDPRPRIVLLRHGETEWSRTGRHTGRTDVPLTEAGEAAAAALRGRLPVARAALVLSSPLRRAADTGRLAGVDGLGVPVEMVDDLAEWDYGEVEGRTTAEIREDHPGWDIWDAGPRAIARSGETLDEVGARADRVLARCLAEDGDVVLVGHGHALRILGARWLGLPPVAGRGLLLDAGRWSLLAWERSARAIASWNVAPCRETP
ncbi:MAG: histidine phosphatase family protein [Actinobacteria bacterium]|nr:histidine phosphatase family protein [Actinomycetota bacterium]